MSDDLRQQSKELSHKLANIAVRYPIEVVPFILIAHLIAAAQAKRVKHSYVRDLLRHQLQEIPSPRSWSEVERWPKGHLKDPEDFEVYASMFDSDVNHLWSAELADINAVLNALTNVLLSLVSAGVRKDYILNTLDEEWEHTKAGETIKIDPRRRQRPGGDFNGLS